MAPNPGVPRRGSKMMSQLIKSTKATLLLASIPLCAVPASAATGDGEELVELPSKPISSMRRVEAEPIRAYSRNSEFCLAEAAPHSETLAATRCPFVDQSTGIELQSRQDFDFGHIDISASFQRESEGMFSARRQLTTRHRGMNEESSLATIGINSSFFDGRIKTQSKLAWSREWSSPLTGGPYSFDKVDELSGSAQSHRLDLKLLGGPDLRWSVTGQVNRASDDYRVGRVASLSQVYASRGTSHRLSTKLGIGQLDLSAAFGAGDTEFYSRRSFDLAAYRKGINLRASQRSGRTKPNSLFSHSTRHSGKQAYGMDVDLYALAPRLAFSKSAASSLVPKSLSITYSTEAIETRRAIGPSLGRYQSLDASAIWDTPLGNTVAGMQLRDGRELIATPTRSRERLYYLMHSFDWGNWNIGVDVTSSDNRPLGGHLTSNRMVSFGHSLTYSAPDGPKFRLRLGKDDSWIGSDDIFTIDDRTTYIDAKLDLTRHLRKQLEGQDVALTLQYRSRIGRGRLELTLLEETGNVEIDRFNREGLLLNFSKRF